MIRVLLVGGLGNQIFQLAEIYRLRAKGYDVDVLTASDPTSIQSSEILCQLFDLDVSVSGSLQRRIQKVSEANEILVLAKTKQHLGHINILLKSIATIIHFRWLSEPMTLLETNEKQFKFKKDYLITGLWQQRSELPIQLSKEIMMNASKMHLNDFAMLVQRDTSLVVHLRCGDYRNPDSIHKVLDPAYYLKAIERIMANKAIRDVVIVSNSTEKCACTWLVKREVNLWCSCQRRQDVLEDFLLLFRAQNVVIANSTFSLSACLLSKGSKVVIAPKEWMSEKSIASEPHIPAWITRI